MLSAFIVLQYIKFIRVKLFCLMIEPELMTIEEIADYLRVKKRTVYEWLKKGKIPAFKTVGQWRFKRAQIDRWLESQQG